MYNKKKTKKGNDKGITLIALIITIIVMLILVAVTVNVALNGGLFGKANKSAKDTEMQSVYEQTVAAMVLDDNGDFNVNATGEAAREHFKTTLDSNANWTYDGGTNSGTLTVHGKRGTYEIEISAAGIGQPRIATASTGGNGSGGNTTNNYLAALTQEQQEGGLSLVSYDSLSEDLKTAVTEEKVSAVVQETIGGETLTAVIPANFTIDSEAFKISEGLVIKDSNNNEFVWIPVPGKNMQASYTVDNYSEPTALTSNDSNSGTAYDSSETITYYYGDAISYNDDFDYTGDYAEMVASVNKYGGFYIGRYETTIDSSNNVGSKVNTEVLTAGKTLASLGNRSAMWWGLYYLQRRTNVVGLGTAVQTNMIWGQQWDKMISYFSGHSIDFSATKVGTLSTSQAVVNSGQAEYSYNGIIKDVIYNIYDLRGNAFDWTAEACDTVGRVVRGGRYNARYSADSRLYNDPYSSGDYYCSRATLYIK